MITEETAKRVAEWWADKVCQPKFSWLSAEERASGQNRTYELAEVMASILVKPVEEDAREAFIAALTTRIIQEQPRWLDVDYHPCPLLAEVGEETGIPPNNWPWKTHVSFLKDGTAMGSSGYGAEPIQI